jgi:HEAT repeat protein
VKQETADMMIDAEILPITSELLKCEEAEVREQAALLLGSFAISAIGRQLFEYAFPNLKELLEDENLDVRVATSWAFKQLTVNDDGCQRMVEN